MQQKKPHKGLQQLMHTFFFFFSFLYLLCIGATTRTLREVELSPIGASPSVHPDLAASMASFCGFAKQSKNG